jgi:hypothetical protein
MIDATGETELVDGFEAGLAAPLNGTELSLGREVRGNPAPIPRLGLLRGALFPLKLIVEDRVLLSADCANVDDRLGADEWSLFNMCLLKADCSLVSHSDSDSSTTSGAEVGLAGTPLTRAKLLIIELLKSAAINLIVLESRPVDKLIKFSESKPSG